uniref:AlNc14C210G8906 protein n=1 Tax=Albugo laibachii Nc14 TaxID=890382 RepID=F0WR99_9STRA|nr:AlNc14C210G8906 [Albugo laibachii Nc14]CCA24046.1 AlNc14C219G9075 [Albugo laibachii Nc14]|eukprot:CCA24046.1 AlNc14C219G9075 [Albugo laibachii Nc14]
MRNPKSNAFIEGREKNEIFPENALVSLYGLYRHRMSMLPLLLCISALNGFKLRESSLLKQPPL